MYLKITSLLSGIVWSSRVIGHCSQFAKSSSVYPMRKYIFRGLIDRLKIEAILMWLNWRFMMTSEQTSEWKVAVMNLRMKMSSVIVCASLIFSPRRFAGSYQNFKNRLHLPEINSHQCSTNSMLFYDQSYGVDLPSRKSGHGLVSV